MTSASSDDLSATEHSAREHAFFLLLLAAVEGADDDDEDMTSDFVAGLSSYVTINIGYENTIPKFY